MLQIFFTIIALSTFIFFQLKSKANQKQQIFTNKFFKYLEQEILGKLNGRLLELCFHVEVIICSVLIYMAVLLKSTSTLPEPIFSKYKICKSSSY